MKISEIKQKCESNFYKNIHLKDSEYIHTIENGVNCIFATKISKDSEDEIKRYYNGNVIIKTL